MRKGLAATNSQHQGYVLNAFAMYSDEYIPGTRLSKENIQEVYEKEVLKIVKNGAYMGIWQVLALSNVLQLPVFSVYPHLGNTFIRTDLHRLILPRVCAEENAMKAPPPL